MGEAEEARNLRKPSTRRPGGVVFDCDGVLLDSMPMWHSLDDRLATRAGVKFTREDRDYLTAGTIEECSRYMFEKYGVGECAEHVQQLIYDDMMNFYTHEVKPKPGAMELVKALCEAGIPMAVASSTPPRLLKAGLAAAGFESYMCSIMSVDELGCTKREPLVFDKARESLAKMTPSGDVPAREDTWVVEDSLYAINTANAAGFRTFGVYDSDLAGSRDQLEKATDRFTMSLEGLSPDAFNI